MPRYAIQVQYDGTNYVGYQVQPNGPTIQAALEKALRKMAKLDEHQMIATVGSGRTDSGVHALGQVVHFDYPVAIPTTSLIRALNSLLDPSIRILQAAQVADDFHARYHAKGKIYVYRVDLAQSPDPFKRLYTLHHPYRIDVSRMQQAVQAIIGTHDFTSFCSIKTDKEDKIRTIYQATVTLDEGQNELIFRFHGNGFLYNMVRILVGTLLQIGDGLRPVNELQRLLEIKERKQAGPTAAAHGLYMVQVDYEVNPFG